jgi:hypothetical protein
VCADGDAVVDGLTVGWAGALMQQKQ